MPSARAPPRNPLESASPTTVGVVDQLLDYMKAHRLRVTDVFKMLDVAKAGRIRNAVLLTQRLYEFEVVQSLEEVKKFVADMSRANVAASSSSSSSSSSSPARSHASSAAPSFSYDEFYKVLTHRRRYRPSPAPADLPLATTDDDASSTGGRSAAASSHAAAAAAGRRAGVGGGSPQRSDGPGDGSGQQQKNHAFSQQLVERQRVKRELLQQKIEEKRAAVSEQKAAALAQKVRDEEVRRQQLTRELAVIQLGEMEASLQRNAAQQILASVADAEGYYAHRERRLNERFDAEVEDIRATLDIEAEQIEHIGHSAAGAGGAAGRGAASTTGGSAPGQARQASITERRCVAVLRQLRDAKVELAETARRIEVARTHIERDNAARHRHGQKIRCVLACLQELLPRLGSNAPHDTKVQALLAGRTGDAGDARGGTTDGSDGGDGDSSAATDQSHASSSATNAFKQIQQRLASMDRCLPSWATMGVGAGAHSTALAAAAAQEQ